MHIFNNRVVKSFVVTPGADFSTEVSKQVVDLTPEMIQRYEKNSKQSTYTHKHSLGLDMTTKISLILLTLYGFHDSMIGRIVNVNVCIAWTIVDKTHTI